MAFNIADKKWLLSLKHDDITKELIEKNFAYRYDKETKKYSVDIEAIYQWDDKSGIAIYLQSLLNQFTKYMTDNNLKTNYKISFYDIFYGKIGIECEADTIEECYAKFKFIVDGYCRMWERESEE